MDPVAESIELHERYFDLSASSDPKHWINAQELPAKLDDRIRVYNVILARLIVALHYLATLKKKVHVVEVDVDLLEQSNVFNQDLQANLKMLDWPVYAARYSKWAAGLVVHIKSDIDDGTMYRISLEMPWIHDQSFIPEFKAWLLEFFPGLTFWSERAFRFAFHLKRKTRERAAKRRKVEAYSATYGYFKAVDAPDYAFRNSPLFPAMLQDLTQMNRDVCSVVASFFVPRPWYEIVAELFTREGPGYDYKVEPLCVDTCTEHEKHVRVSSKTIFV